MTTTERLSKIKVQCESLLAIAENRTPGKWSHCEKGDYLALNKRIGLMSCIIADDLGPKVAEAYKERDSAFIASCAGSAEAGWRATIDAVDACIQFQSINAELTKQIIAAWPEELL